MTLWYSQAPPSTSAPHRAASSATPIVNIIPFGFSACECIMPYAWGDESQDCFIVSTPNIQGSPGGIVVLALLVRCCTMRVVVKTGVVAWTYVVDTAARGGPVALEPAQPCAPPGFVFDGAASNPSAPQSLRQQLLNGEPVDELIAAMMK
jgi:hypothetical protein